MMEELVVGDPGVDKSLNTFFVCHAKIATESVKCYEMIRSLVDTLGTYLPHKKENFFYDIYNNLQYFSTGQAKAISSSLHDDWFVFQDDKELTGNADTIKGGLDNVKPQPAPMLPRFTGEYAWLKGPKMLGELTLRAPLCLNHKRTAVAALQFQ